MRRRVVVEARAKLNLGLAVGPRRSDGYHDIVTVFQSISLADTLLIEPRARGFSLAIREENVAVRGRASCAGPDVPRGSENIVVRAARLLARHLGFKSGARFTLIKRIPSRAGLGGASADAAAALVGLAALHGARLTRNERLELGAALGSDIPFALVGGTALGLGRGEKLTKLRLAEPLRAVVAFPEWGISTAQAYRRVDRLKNNLTLWNAKLRFTETLERKQLRAATIARFGNTFEQVLGARRPDFESLRTRLRRCGLVGVRMTGSGSAVFGLLGPTKSAKDVSRCFEGAEALFVVRSARTGMRLRYGP